MTHPPSRDGTDGVLESAFQKSIAPKLLSPKGGGPDSHEGPESTSQGSQVRILHRPLRQPPPPIGGVEVRRGMPNAEYHADASAFSKSQYWCHANDGPAAFYERYIARSIPAHASASLSHGTLLHGWFEEGDSFWQGVIAPPERTLTAGGAIGKEAKKWHAENCPDATLVSPSEMAQLRAEVAALQADPAVADILDNRQEAEVSIWFDIDDFPTRCRPDLLASVDGQTRIIDLKTTRQTNLVKNWWRAVMDYGYHMQDYLYQRGGEAMGLDPMPLVFVVVSTSPPHEVLVCTLPPALSALGGTTLHESIADIRLRMETACWLPDHAGEVMELPVPAHVMGGLR